MEKGTELASLEAAIEAAFGPVPIPDPETLLGWMVNSRGEADWVFTTFGGKRYNEVDLGPAFHDFLHQMLSPNGFAYYIGSAALTAVRHPLEKEDDLVTAFSLDDAPEGTLTEEYALLDVARLSALRLALVYVREECLRVERTYQEEQGLPEDRESEESCVEPISKALKPLDRIEPFLV